MEFEAEKEFDKLISLFVDNESKKNVSQQRESELKSLVANVQNKVEFAGEYLEKQLDIKVRNKNRFRTSSMGIVILGDNSILLNILTRFGLKKSRAEGELSTPFDLAIHPVSTVAKLIDTDFYNYLNPAEFIIEYGHPVHDRLRVMFNHERSNDFRENNYEKLIDRYKARIEDFYLAVSSGKTLFVVNTSVRKGIDDLIGAIGRRLNPINDVLLVLNTGKETFSENEFISVPGLELQIFNCPFPSEDYVWFQTKYYSSSLGYEFELSVSDKVADILLRSEGAALVLSKKNTIDMCLSNSLNLDGIVTLLHEDIIGKLKKDVVGEGFEAHKDVCEVLVEYSERHGLSVGDIEGMSSKFIYNLAYVFPNIFIKSLNDPFKYIMELEHNAYQALLTRPIIQAYLNSTLEGNVDLWSLYPKNLLSLFLSLTANRINSIERERYLLEILIGSMEPCYSKITYEALLMRLDSITNNISIDSKVNRDGRIALFISGQLRGYKDALPSVLNRFEDLSKVDVFISTWEEVGGTQYTEERLPRIFEKDAISKIFDGNNFGILKEVYESLERDSNASGNIHKELRKLCNGVHSIKINLKSDKDYPFNKMSNPEKMYYHNAYWIESLGENYFENYNMIVKTRPDLWFPEFAEKFDKVKCELDTVYCENKDGWIYREWGFGMGDQLIYGNAPAMLGVLSTHGEAKLSTKIVGYLTPGSSSYVGHINCGVQAWLDGLDCKHSAVIPLKICSVKKITLSEVEGLLTIAADRQGLRAVEV